MRRRVVRPGKIQSLAHLMPGLSERPTAWFL
jgi:hypothetical protein